MGGRFAWLVFGVGCVACSSGAAETGTGTGGAGGSSSNAAGGSAEVGGSSEGGSAQVGGSSEGGSTSGGSSATGGGSNASGGSNAGGGSNASGGSNQTGGSSASGGSSAGGSGGGGGSAACVEVGAAFVDVATAPIDGEYALTLPATSASSTSWREAGNEALILDVRGGTRAVGQLVLHQGHDGFTYGMSLGHLAAGELISVKVSVLSAANATPPACVGPAKLVSAAELGAAGEGLTNAPIFKWPVKKRFDDLPVMLGWSKARKHYEAYYTNENGGTAELCGGGADGMQAEISRWGRAADIEGMFDYGAAVKRWERCDGTIGVDTHPLRFEGAHPIVYYGDGHNRLFESRGGYGQACGTDGDKKADGDLVGWNVQNPGNDAGHDDAFVVTIRPLPVALDALGYASHSGRREGALDVYAPWLYRVTDGELEREGKIDGSRVQPMANVLFVDVHANDVGGSGDSYCSFMRDGGFKLRVNLQNGTTVDGPQMTADYFGGQDNIKRIAIPLGAPYVASQIKSLTFDAYDDDGIYFLQLGDAFIPKPAGENGATLAVVHAGTTNVNKYVDDDSSNCSGGMNPDGPSPPYPCVGGAFTVNVP